MDYAIHYSQYGQRCELKNKTEPMNIVVSPISPNATKPEGVVDDCCIHVVVYTYSMSPYQVEYFDAISETSDLNLKVIYYRKREKHRRWADSGASHRFSVWSVRLLREMLRELERADLVVLSSYHTVPAWILLFMSVYKRKRRVFWGERFHQPSATPHYIVKSTLRKLYLNSVHGVWAIGELARRDYSSVIRTSSAVDVLPYYSQLKRFFEIKRAARRPRQVLYIGELSHRKGVDQIVKMLKDEAPWFLEHDFSFHFVGNGELSGAVERLSEGLPSLVKSHPSVPWGGTADLYGAADVILCPSRHDGWCLVVVEAMASAAIVISSTTTGAAVERIESEKSGFLVSEVTSKALFQKMASVSLLTPSEASAISRRARDRVRDLDVPVGVRRVRAMIQKQIGLNDKSTE